MPKTFGAVMPKGGGQVDFIIRDRVPIHIRVRAVRSCSMRYAIVIENAGSNFSAYVPDLPGCVATGVSAAAVAAAVREAIVFHLEGLRADGQPIPTPASTVDYVEVAA
jgi:predicted RNase H-like HicB family nuclease